MYRISFIVYITMSEEKTIQYIELRRMKKRLDRVSNWEDEKEMTRQRIEMEND